jgi:hypothetical protein
MNRTVYKLIFRNKDDYDVNNEGKGDAEKGRENKAFDNEAEAAKKAAAATTSTVAQNGSQSDQKWVSNYVPYGDYPKGNVVYVKEVSSEKVVLFYS